jgi:monoamine oxidase
MTDRQDTWSRRRFLETVGKAGGAAAVYETMVALGLLRVPAARAEPLQLPADVGKGQTVVILGAGVGGLAAAYELRKAGYAVEILEASSRLGGRNFTVRHGDEIEQNGRDPQECRFDADPGLYFNAGPGRIPYHHREIIHYCRELGVPLEVYVMESRANLFQTDAAFDKKAVVNRRVANDTRGYIAELLAKAVTRGALDEELTREDRQRLLDLLVPFGQVKCDNQYKYVGSSRSGYVVQPAVVEAGKIEPPLSLQSLLASEFWKYRFYQPEDYEWQTTLFQPVGGMDQIVVKFVEHIEKLGGRIMKDAQVIRVENSAQKVKVSFRNPKTGKEDSRTADYCISNIPLPLLRRIVDNGTFDEDFQRAVGAVPFAPACKVGWQADERFWETQNEIYGGISWIADTITQFWYPSAGYFMQKGILTGLYNYGETADRFGGLPLDERLTVARKGAEKLHPGFAKYCKIGLGLSIAWQSVPHLEGGWADWTGSLEQKKAYQRLLRPDKKFWVCGDQISYLPGWQQGAVLSAQHVVEHLPALGKLEALPAEIFETPFSSTVTGAVAQ